MTSFRTVLIGLAALAAVEVATSRAEAKGGTLDFDRDHGTLQLPKAAPVPPYRPYNGAAPPTNSTPHRAPTQSDTSGGFKPYKPYKGTSPYGGDPTSLTPRRNPYESNMPGGFKPFRSGYDTTD